MATKSAAPRKRKKMPARGAGDKTAAVRMRTHGPKVKQPSVKPRAKGTERSEGIEFSQETQAGPDLPKVAGSSELSGEATAKLWKRSRAQRLASRDTGAVKGRAARSVYGGRSKASVSKIEKEDKAHPG